MTRSLEQRTELRQGMTFEQRVIFMESLVDELDSKIDECDDRHKRDAKLIEMLTKRVAELEKVRDGGS